MPLLWIVGGLALVAFVVSNRQRKKARERHILEYEFPAPIARKVKEAYPHLTDEQVQLVIQALRDFFLISIKAKGRMVAMPSKVVDVAWHEFIVFTKAYQRFCRVGLGRFLHHTPSEAMTSPTVAQAGIARAWRLACAKELINPKSPTRLPLLFAIDAQLEIPEGYYYSLNCSPDGSTYCASHIGCGGGCGGSSCGSGDSGCGGGGCGGGD